MSQLMMRVALVAVFLFSSTDAMAVDSYRYLHVTIETPWMIFIFLFFLVVAPMILSAILHLRNAMRHDRDETDSDDVHGDGNKESESGIRHD